MSFARILVEGWKMRYRLKVNIVAISLADRHSVNLVQTFSGDFTGTRFALTNTCAFYRIKTNKIPVLSVCINKNRRCIALINVF